MRGGFRTAVFVDTGAFVAYRNILDAYHERADEIIRRALKEEFGVIFTTNFIYDEAMTLAAVRTGDKDVVADISDVILSPRIGMIIVDEIVLSRARELFFKYFKRKISFTDATTMAVMKKLEIDDIITFDAHFRGIFNILPGNGAG